MTKFCGCLNILVMIVAFLTFALMAINCDCRAVASKEDVNDGVSELKSLLELSTRDEIVKMAGYGEDKLSSVLVTGMVACNRVCLPGSYGHHQPSPRPISGAFVGVTCHIGTKEKRLTRAEAVTDEDGEFMIDLPSHLHAIQDLEKACSVKVLKMPNNSPCHHLAFSRPPNGIRISSVGNGIRTYTTGTITFLQRLPNESEACMKGQEDEQEMSW